MEACKNQPNLQGREGMDVKPTSGVQTKLSNALKHINGTTETKKLARLAKNPQNTIQAGTGQSNLQNSESLIFNTLDPQRYSTRSPPPKNLNVRKRTYPTRKENQHQELLRNGTVVDTDASMPGHQEADSLGQNINGATPSCELPQKKRSKAKKYKNLTNEESEKRRLRSNKLERKRAKAKVESMNTLAKVIPEELRASGSKIETLRSSIFYIKSLADLIKTYDEAHKGCCDPVTKLLANFQTFPVDGVGTKTTTSKPRTSGKKRRSRIPRPTIINYVSENENALPDFIPPPQFEPYTNDFPGPSLHPWAAPVYQSPISFSLPHQQFYMNLYDAGWNYLSPQCPMPVTTQPFTSQNFLLVDHLRIPAFASYFLQA